VELALGRSVGADEVRSAFSFSGSDRNHVMVTEAADLGNSDDARVEAAKRIGLLLHAHAGKLWADEEWQMDVTDDTGLIPFVINIAAMKSSATLLTCAPPPRERYRGRRSSIRGGGSWQSL